MRVLHVTTTRRLTLGQAKQLSYEVQCAGALGGVNWDVLALVAEPIGEVYEQQMPGIMGRLFLRDFYTWYYLFRRRAEYDFILLRHNTFDPSALLWSPFLHNRVSVHHAKEVEELIHIRPGLKGRLASALERITGRFGLRRVRGVIGVTQEIADYELARAGVDVPTACMPNGIMLSSIPLVDDERQNDEVHLAFVCGRFAAWHGLEALIRSARTYAADAESTGAVRIHLIGELLAHQVQEIESDPGLARLFMMHGPLTFDQYKAVIVMCDVSLASFALEQKGLEQASTLKVRESLALGLPVYSGHIDAALPQDFPYYRIGPPDLSDIVAYARLHKATSRVAVRTAAKPYIDKAQILQRTVAWLRELQDTARGPSK